MSWRRFFERDRRDAELARELSAHLELEVDDLVARGVPQGEARSRAARTLGNVTSLREVVYERNSLVTLEAVLKDARYALRQLRRNRVFTAVAMLSLALGIGANTAIFSLLDQSLWRPLPVRDPQELVFLYHPGPLEGHSSSDETGAAFSYPVFRGLRAAQTPFTDIAAQRALMVNVVRAGQGTLARAYRVSGNYFELLGVRPGRGRLFTDADDARPGAHPVAVLSHVYWQRAFGGDPGVIDRTLSVNGVSLTIVGVAAAGFFGDARGPGPDLYVPLSMNDALVTGRESYGNRGYHWIPLLARLKPGIGPERAAAEINVAYRAEVEQDLVALNISTDDQATYRAKRIVLRPGASGRGRWATGAKVFLPAGITLLVLVIACANIANLQLARATARAREMLVRVALGASRAALVRQLLTESLLLALAGGALGLVLARWMVRAAGTQLAISAVGPLSDALDGRVLLFTLAASTLTALACGLYPALHASRPDLATAIKDESAPAGATRAARRLRLSLVTGQLALSMLLVILAGLLTKTLVNLARVDVGFAADHLVTFDLEPDARRYDRPRAAAFLRELRERLAAIPGVRGVSTAAEPVLAGSSSSGSVTIDTPQGRVAEKDQMYNVVGPRYLETMGITLVAGREITDADGPDAPRVAVVNEAFARKYFGDGSPIGYRLGSSIGDGVTFDIEIVGVARDAKYHSLRETVRPFYYLSRGTTPLRQAQFYLQTTVPPETLFAAVQREVAALDPQLPVRRMKTVRRQLEENVSGERALSTLAASFGGLATLLAALGLYGVLAYNVALRTREIGLRIALGAGAREVWVLLGREIGLVLGIGGLMGIAGAALAGRAVQAILYGVQPWDPAVYASAAAALGVVALVAAYIPARRAAGIDPARALRCE